MTTTISCPGCRRQLSLPKDALNVASQCPRCGATFTARETVDKLGSTLTVQAGDTGEDLAFGALQREAEAEARREAPRVPSSAKDPADWWQGPVDSGQSRQRESTPTEGFAWEPDRRPEETPRTGTSRPRVPAPWPEPTAPWGGKRKVLGWTLVTIFLLGSLSQGFRNQHTPPRPRAPVPVLAANWGQLAGTWTDPLGSNLTIDAQGRVNGRLVEANGNRELKIGMGDIFGAALLRKDGVGAGYLELQVTNVDAHNLMEHCRLTFRLVGNNALEITETPQGDGGLLARNRSYQLTRNGAGF